MATSLCVPIHDKFVTDLFVRKYVAKHKRKVASCAPLLEEKFIDFLRESEQQTESMLYKSINTGDDIYIIKQLEKSLDECLKIIKVENYKKKIEKYTKKVDKIKAEIEVKQESLSYKDFTIKIKTLTGLTIVLPVNVETTVLNLNQMIVDYLEHPVDQQRLIFNAKQLDVKKKIVEYGIKNDSCIHIILRLRGGMFHISTDADGADNESKKKFYITCEESDIYNDSWMFNYVQNLTNHELRKKIVETAIEKDIKLPSCFKIEVKFKKKYTVTYFQSCDQENLDQYGEFEQVNIISSYE